MSSLTEGIEWLNALVWGPPMLVAILGIGLFLSVGLRMMPVRQLGTAFRLLWAGRRADGEGDIPAFQALTTALSATVGTGNIAGVATAIFLGGPGALFWMWCTAVVGMATKYAESVCAVQFRQRDARGYHVGGPMYYIRNGLGPRWSWLAVLFALFGSVAAFGIGNTVQANSVAQVLDVDFGVPRHLTGIVLAGLTLLVLLGGIRRIGQVTARLVPFMAALYIGAGLLILLLHAAAVPGALALVLESAFTPTAAQGGFAGAAVWAAMQFGVARGIFSNEAGLGSAAIAHAAATSRDPVEQGLIGMLGTFIDTLVVCSITGLVIIVTGAWMSGETGAALTSLAFSSALSGPGGALVALSVALFAYSTLIGWSYYGERCVAFLFGIRAIQPFRFCWILAIPVGALVELETIWLLADTLNALMALPNLVGLALLSPVVFQLTRAYLRRPGLRDEPA